MTDTDSAIWEPRIWAVGDRVRVRVSPECQTRLGTPSYHGSTGVYGSNSTDVIGDVIEVIGDNRFPRDGHRFFVSNEDDMWRDWFAAIELEAADDAV